MARAEMRWIEVNRRFQGLLAITHERPTGTTFVGNMDEWTPRLAFGLRVRSGVKQDSSTGRPLERPQTF